MRLALFIVALTLIEMGNCKFVKCTHRFYETNYLYCTKFGASSNSIVNLEFKTRLLNTNQKQQSSADRLTFSVHIFQDDKWDEFGAIKSPTCKDIERLATVSEPAVGLLDGTWSDLSSDPTIRSYTATYS